MSINPAVTRPAVVLCCAGHDPSGGAGVHADVEAVRAQGAHPLSLITTLTTQDSHNVVAQSPLDADHFQAQARCLMADLPIDAVKLGLLGSVAMAHAVARLLDALHQCGPAPPVVIDPILRAGGGTDLADDALVDALREQLLPRSQLITPNLAEARRLADLPTADHNRCAVALQALGAQWILLTGGDEDTAQVHNRLYAPGISQPTHRWQWPRLPGRFHGSGCTLSAALSAKLAQGMAVADAAEQAQHYTQRCLQQAYRLSRGQAFPARWNSQA